MSINIEQATIGVIPRARGPAGPPGTPGDQVSFETMADAAAAEIDAAVNFLRTAGRAARGDGGAALYVRRAIEPAHPGKFQNADDGSWWELTETLLHPEHFGAFGGGPDDSAGLRDMIDTAISRPAKMSLRANYYTSVVLNIEAMVSIEGLGAHVGIHPLTNDINVLNINTTAPVTLRDFSIIYPEQAQAGTVAVTVTAPGSGINGQGSGGTVIENVNLQLVSTGISFLQAASYNVCGCTIKGDFIGISVQNLVAEDVNDSTITECTISVPGGIGIFQRSGGGLRIENNKIIGVDTAIALSLAEDVRTAVLIIANNSIEIVNAVGGASITLAREVPSSDSGFSVVKISDNELAGQFGVLIPHDSVGIWLQNVSITDNIYIGSTEADSVFISLDSVLGFKIEGNLIQSPGVTQVVTTGADADRGHVGPNYAYVTEAGSITASSFASTNTTTVTPT